MLDWFSQNSSSVMALSNVLLVLVWAFYLQLFIYGYRRQRRPRILIGFGGRESFDARCLITNMSAEPVYVISVIATIRAGRDTWSQALTGYETARGDGGGEETEQRTREGPLLSGDYRDIGRYGDLLERASAVRGAPAEADSEDDGDGQMDLTVVAFYGSEELPVAAARSFMFTRTDGDRQIHPISVETSQIRSRWARRRLRHTVSQAPWDRAHLPHRRHRLPRLLRT